MLNKVPESASIYKFSLALVKTSKLMIIVIFLHTHIISKEACFFSIEPFVLVLRFSTYFNGSLKVNNDLKFSLFLRHALIWYISTAMPFQSGRVLYSDLSP